MRFPRHIRFKQHNFWVFNASHQFLIFSLCIAENIFPDTRKFVSLMVLSFFVLFIYYLELQHVCLILVCKWYRTFKLYFNFNMTLPRFPWKYVKEQFSFQFDECQIQFDIYLFIYYIKWNLRFNLKCFLCSFKKTKLAVLWFVMQTMAILSKNPARQQTAPNS